MVISSSSYRRSQALISESESGMSQSGIAVGFYIPMPDSDGDPDADNAVPAALSGKNLSSLRLCRRYMTLGIADRMWHYRRSNFGSDEYGETETGHHLSAVWRQE